MILLRTFFALFIIKAVPLHAMEALRERGGIAPALFLTSVLYGGEWLLSHPGEETPGTHWM
jgi:hypothetical protein